MQKYADIVKRASAQFQVPEDLIWAMIREESSGDSTAVSSAGATGLMQLMPGTAKDLGVTDMTDPEQNIMGGTKYIAQLIKRYNGDKKLALAAYNRGMSNIDKDLAKAEAAGFPKTWEGIEGAHKAGVQISDAKGENLEYVPSIIDSLPGKSPAEESIGKPWKEVAGEFPESLRRPPESPPVQAKGTPGASTKQSEMIINAAKRGWSAITGAFEDKREDESGTTMTDAIKSSGKSIGGAIERGAYHSVGLGGAYDKANAPPPVPGDPNMGPKPRDQMFNRDFPLIGRNNSYQQTPEQLLQRWKDETGGPSGSMQFLKREGIGPSLWTKRLMAQGFIGETDPRAALNSAINTPRQDPAKSLPQYPGHPDLNSVELRPSAPAPQLPQYPGYNYQGNDVELPPYRQPKYGPGVAQPTRPLQDVEPEQRAPGWWNETDFGGPPMQVPNSGPGSGMGVEPPVRTGGAGTDQQNMGGPPAQIPQHVFDEGAERIPESGIPAMQDTSYTPTPPPMPPVPLFNPNVRGGLSQSEYDRIGKEIEWKQSREFISPNDMNHSVGPPEGAQNNFFKNPAAQMRTGVEAITSMVGGGLPVPKGFGPGVQAGARDLGVMVQSARQKALQASQHTAAAARQAGSKIADTAEDLVRAGRTDLGYVKNAPKPNPLPRGSVGVRRVRTATTKVAKEQFWDDFSRLTQTEKDAMIKTLEQSRGGVPKWIKQRIDPDVSKAVDEGLFDLGL